jgi:hypothetical protein
MEISFRNMTVELNIFNINNQPLEYDEAHLACLIEEIIDDIVSDFGLKGLEIECFTQEEDDLDFDRLIGQNEVLYEPSLEDPKIGSLSPATLSHHLRRLFYQTQPKKSILMSQKSILIPKNSFLMPQK